MERGKKNYITSPGYPSAYLPGIKCNFLINAPPGYHIEYALEKYYSPYYHDDRKTDKPRFMSPYTANYTCKWYLAYNVGMLSFYEGNS